MNEKEVLKRKIKLKTQAISIIRSEREELKQRLSLLHIRDNLLKQMTPEFNRELSEKLDCIDFLLKEKNETSNTRDF
jgi:hypothetical protein